MHRKIYHLIMVFICSAGLLSGQTNEYLNIAVKHIKQNADQWGMKSSDFADIMISSQVTSDKGLTYLYLNQAYQGIPIRNAMMVIVIDKDGKVLSDAHNFVTNTASKINTGNSGISAQEAILKSAEHLEVSVKSKPTMQSRSDQGKLLFNFAELVKSPIPAELKYDIVGDKLILVWNLNLDMKNSADYWDINMDANTGVFVSKHNFTTYCKHQKDGFAKHEDCAIRTFRKISDNTQHIDKLRTAGSSAATYNIFALPAESPNHGPRKIVTDEQFPLSSPYGWHDTDGKPGAEFTITRGNNVYAYQDKNDDDEPDGTPTDGGSSLNFDFPIDLSKDPRESADASVTNLFYMVNMMHDVTSMVGFTEEFGNFQQKNYTNKGEGGDYVLAQAFDGAEANPAKLNNANFSTPVDGFNGRMQMFFWNNDGGAVSIDAPEQIKGFVAEYGAAQFGKPIPTANESPITASVAIAKVSGANPTSGCGTISNASEIKGKIAIIDRGICQFSTKVLNAQKAGAVAAIICNIPGVNGGNGEELLGMAGGNDGTSVTIPSVFFKKSDCDKIRVILNNGGEVVMTFQERERQGAAYLDGSLDNGIIAHEFGHGISTRLTGGRLNSSCLNNDEQMGEGWSDFFALVMTHEDGDKGTDKRGIGTFAAAQQITGGGIRRYPYSTDMRINPQTFDAIKGTTEPHPLGEVWTDMLWDMYWAFIDQYGYDKNWGNKNSGNYKAVFLVMEGLKLQTCNPGFIQGRDAILKADDLQFKGENKCLIWKVFARRGLGFYASGGSTADRNDGTENFEALPTCIEKLKISKTATSSINPGDDVTVTLTAVNHLPTRQNNVLITDDLPQGMTYVQGSSNIAPVVSGNTISFEVGNMEFDKPLTITYKTKSSTSNKSIRLEFENFDNGDFEWDVERIKGSEDWVPTADLFRSPETSFNMINVAAEVDATLYTIPYTVKGNNPVLRFWHRYNTQAGNDGGFVEISVDNGPAVPVKKEKFIRNAYNGPLAYGTLAIPSLDAFSGSSGGNWTGNLVGPWIDSYIDLSEYKGKTIVVRFRFASDATIVATGTLNGWYVDDFEILDIYKYTSQACIAAEGGQGEKACTNAVETIVNSALTSGIKKEENLNYFNLRVMPNPADEYVIISSGAPVSAPGNIEILNTEGKVVYKRSVILDANHNQYVVSTTELPAGIYMVKVTSGDQVSTKKLIIK